MALRKRVQQVDEELIVLRERLRTEPLTLIQITRVKGQIDALLEQRHRIAPAVLLIVDLTRIVYRAAS